MRNYIGNIISGIVGGALCFGLIQYAQPQHVELAENPTAKLVSDYSALPVGVPGSNDFITAAAKSTPAVVHIHCEESQEQVRNRNRRNPFGFEDLFGGSDFFGMEYFRDRDQSGSGTGSGVFYSQDGYIITNNHVVGFGDVITVTTSDGKKYKAKRIGADKSTDLAVIKIEGSGFPTLKLANSEQVKVGEWVLAVGNPFDLNSTVTAGIVSAKGRELGIIKDKKALEDFIQTDAAVNPGNSGGALINLTGELIGINTAIATPTGTYAGYSFAIPANIVKTRITSIIETGSDFQRVDLGIGGYDVDKELKDELKLTVNSGFYIDEVTVASPAKYAGILPGDVIVGINNTIVNDYSGIETAMKYVKQGDSVDIKINRDGKDIIIPTKIKKGI
jgi:serine protease Do